MQEHTGTREKNHKFTIEEQYEWYSYINKLRK